MPYIYTLILVFALSALALAGMGSTLYSVESLSFSPPSLDEPVPSTAELVRAVEPARAETLSYVIQAGEVLIFNLPGLLNEREIELYRIKRAPALSWLVTRSFFWRTLAKDAGEHEIHFEALVNGVPVEEVVVIVDVR